MLRCNLIKIYTFLVKTLKNLLILHMQHYFSTFPQIAWNIYMFLCKFVKAITSNWKNTVKSQWGAAFIISLRETLGVCLRRTKVMILIVSAFSITFKGGGKHCKMDEMTETTLMKERCNFNEAAFQESYFH